MGSRQPFPQKPQPKTSIVFLAIGISASLLIISAVVYFIYHTWHSLFHRSRTSPFDSMSPLNRLQKFSHRELKSATSNFSATNSIGKGGSGTVFRGILSDGKLVAVKLLDSNSLQSEQEFQNELKILAGIKPCPLIVSLIGYCVEKDNRLLVFEYMPNRSLQDSLFFDTDSNTGFNSILNWSLRFSIILNVAKALSYLHLDCEPPVVHGDVKPGNVLLDTEFRAKLSDFGLSRFKLEDDVGGDLFSQELSGNLVANGNETPLREAPFESQENGEFDFSLALQASSSSKYSSKIHHHNAGEVSVNLNFISDGGNKGKEFPEDCDLDQSKELNSSEAVVSDDINAGAKQWGKDWWWRQDGSGELCSKDYVTEWIGSQMTQISPDSELHDWDEEKGLPLENKPSNNDDTENMEKHENAAQECGLECLDNDEQVVHKKHRKMHEWWRDENLDEIRKKRKKARRVKVPHFGLGKCFNIRRFQRVSGRKDEINEVGRHREFNFRIGRKKKQKQKIHSTGSDLWSGELFSRELSSTTSMRGTLSYVAPEYNGFGYLMEKSDIYSFGVLILVIISGRRPLHVLASPMRLEKANLISWARSLACSGGSVFELVDERLKDEYCKEEASLCIHLALACLQKVPEMRPDIGDVVRVLRGEMEISQLPFGFSPSPPSRAFSRSRMRGNAGLD